MRLINAVRELRHEPRSGISRDLRTIALHTRAERSAMFVRESDEAVCLDDFQPPGATGSPYLHLGTLSEALTAARADAAWVGWGFVAERPEFAELCERLDITFIGPRPDVMRSLGDKIGAKLLAEQAEVPVAAWSGGAVDTVEAALEHADVIGYPLMIKASAGGGGRGIRRVDRVEQLAEAFESARSEGRQGVRRSDGVHGARRVGRPPRRGAVDRRPSRHGVGGRRPRLQHAAPQPEGDRGVALHRAHARAGSRPPRMLRAASPRSPATRTPARSSSSTSRSSSSSRSSR